MNRTIKRIDFVRKTYGHVPGVVGATIAIITGAANIGGVLLEDVDAVFDVQPCTLRDLGPAVNKRIPWIAREMKKKLVRYAKARVDPNAPPLAATWPVKAFVVRTEWPAIRDWMEATQPDTGRLSWEDAKEQADAWHRELKARAKGGDSIAGCVFLELSNGWTVVELDSKEALEEEGERMGHCVGSYWRYVQQGTRLILSLRDSAKRSHVTAELRPMGGRVYDPIPDGTYHIDQIQGKGNEPPIEKYHPYIIEAFDRPWITEDSRRLWRYRPDARARIWQEVIDGDEDALHEYWSEFSYDVKGVDELWGLHSGETSWVDRGGYEQVLPGDVSLFGNFIVNDDGVTVFEVHTADFDQDRFDRRMEQTEVEFAEEVHHQIECEYPDEEIDHEDLEEMRFEAWDRGSSKAWKALKRSVAQEVDSFDDDWTFYWRFSSKEDELLALLDPESGPRMKEEIRDAVYGLRQIFQNYPETVLEKARRELSLLAEEHLASRATSSSDEA